ncbi:hypothetical protein DMN91_006843 [Ooceraea biroi]|uniref:Uncharacterized protein n=1 Tax=Ooceraea biroi TaxID=2015173 RepID=A0A3L8DIT8_OOCBI|nr:hypothetical protein DMN91_006843 [Ooceraea biroi]
MGCWRRILVDDTIPVDKDSRPLLPCTSNNFELWPMLLAKALLKIASQTWTERREIVDFHPIACLTGWICLTLNIKHLSLQDKWDLLTKYSERFEWTPQTTPENSTSVTTGKPRETLRPLAETEKPQPISLFLLLSNTRELGSDAVPGLSPCWDHVIHVVQSRDVPLDPKDVKEPLAQWKMHRWLKWAISQNVINPADYFVPIRYLRLINPLQECDENVVYEYDIEEKPLKVIQQPKSAWKTKSQKIPDSFTTKEEVTENISRWIDFNKLAPHITEVHLFYKLNIPKKKNINSHQSDYVILEKHNWFFESDQTDQSITIITTGTKSTVLELEAGRQLLQIYRSSESSVIIISSNTTFCLGNRATVQQMMMTESEQIKQMSKKISDNLRAAYRSFGTKDYLAMLKNYYQSYMPSLQKESPVINKNIRTLIHHSFMEEQVRLIRKAFPNEELKNIFHALRVFFLNPDIRLEYFNSVTDQKILQEFTTAEISEDNKDVLRYIQGATIIQSFFKMARVKGYKDLHNPDHPMHTQIRNELHKISDLFDSSFTSQLLRNVINRHHSLRDLYPCSEDFAHVLNIQEFRGVLGNIKHEQWFPIVRLVVNAKPAETVLAVFELLVDLPRVALSVFNNQDRREMPRVVNHVAPARYEHLPTGYTVFAYGRSEKQRFKELDWMIRVITMKGESMLYQLGEQQPLSLETKLPKLAVETLVGVYIPNIKNCISRWILRATPESIVSIRLATSYSLAEVRIRIIDEEGDILTDTKGGCTILLPVVYLKPIEHHKVKKRYAGVDEESKNAVQGKSSYYVEAFVLNDSWPLTDAEWMVVNQAKLKIVGNLETKIRVGNKKSSNSLKKDLRQFVNDDQVLESPYWILQVVTDAQDAVEIYQDKRRDEEIIRLKEFWWSKDPGRRERGRELREAFLNARASKIEPEASSNQNDRQSRRIIEDEDMIFCLSNARQRRTLKPPDSHLLPLDLTKYMRANEIVKHRQIKTKNDDEILKNQVAVNIADSERSYTSYLDKLIELVNEQLQRYSKFFRKKKENFRQRRTLVDAAYESRKVYVDSLASDRAKTKEKKRKKE